MINSPIYHYCQCPFLCIDALLTPGLSTCVNTPLIPFGLCHGLSLCRFSPHPANPLTSHSGRPQCDISYPAKVWLWAITITPNSMRMLSLLCLTQLLWNNYSVGHKGEGRKPYLLYPLVKFILVSFLVSFLAI